MQNNCAAVFLFPHRATSEHLEEIVGETAQRKGIAPRRIASWFELLTIRVNQLRKRVEQAYLVVTEDQAGRMSEISPRFRYCQPAIEIRPGIVVEDDGIIWKTEEYPDYSLILEQIAETRLIIGGFHFCDCVPKFALAARQDGREVIISPRTTDLHYRQYHRTLSRSPFHCPLPRETDLNGYRRIFDVYMLYRWDAYFDS